MKNFKKFLTLVLAVMMVVSSFAFNTSAATTKFEDVDANNEALVEAVDLLAYMGVAKGTSDTTFGAAEKVTRQQFALFIYRLMNEGKDAPKTSNNSTKFTDLEDPTYFYAIAWAQANGIVTGRTTTTFDPKGEITLQEAYTMIVRALDWNEDGNLIYPFGFITVAEQNGVELDKSLDSSVGYADALTRADMAILLYNAFFAETGVEEVKTRERKIGDDDNATWVLEEYTTNPRLCEKKFDVVEVEYDVIATPHYQLTGDSEATYDLGYDAIYAQKTEDSEVNADATEAPGAVYFTPAELGVEADELDTLFLGKLTTFVTVDDDEIEKVLFADVNMTKKTVTELTLGEVSSNKASSYFDGEDAKLLSGKITAGEDVFYAFNAPYSYAEETYATGSSAYEKYQTRNTKNVGTIEFAKYTDGDVDYFEATVADRLVADTAEEDWSSDYTFADEAAALAGALANVYNKGYYEADLYDVDGDGLVDYINYTPYVLFQVDADEDEYFEDSDFTAENNDVPYIYTNEATVLGEDFADEDYVIGYVDEDLEIVKVAAVVKPVVDTIANYKKATGVLTLGNGDKVDAVSAAWKFGELTGDDLVFDVDAAIEEAVADNALFTADVLDEEEREFYIYDGVLVYTEDVDSNVKFTENLIIPTDIKDPRAQFNAEAGEDTWYVYAWIDGAVKYVPVETEDVLPAVLTADDELAAEYANKLCTYTVDSDGIYTIKSLGYDVDDDDAEDYTGIEKDDITVLGDADDEGKDGKQFYFESEATTITKVAGSRFDVGFDRDVDLKSFTKIIIRVYDEDEDEYEYSVFDAASFKKSLDDETELSNMSMIISNNTDSIRREDLVVLYAETTDLAFAGTADKNGYRIVSGNDIGEDEDGEWRIFYELYNPYTGAKEADVPSKDSAKKAGQLDAAITAGTIVNLVDGMVDEDEDAIATVDTANLVWISEVDTAEGYIKVVPVDASLTVKDEIDEYVETTEAAANDIYGEAIDTDYINVDKNTVISVVKYGKLNSDFWNYASMTTATFDDLAAAKKELLCYNNKALDRNGNYKTGYSDYVKAYVAVDADERLDEDENRTAEFIIIVVNGEENAALDA